MDQSSNSGGWHGPQPEVHYGPMRTPKSYLSPDAPSFVPKSQQTPHIPEQQHPPGGGGAFQHPGQQHHYQSQMDMHQSSQSSLVQHRFAAAQGSVEPGGGGGGGGGGGFDYQQQQMGHHLGGNNGAVPNGNNDPGKVSAVQNRLSNMRIGSGGGGGGMSRGDNNGKEFNHHQHHQQPMQQHHLQHRVQQQPYQQQHQGHHGHNHHQPHAQQLHQPQYSYGAGYSNAINNHLNHPILGAANHHMGGGGGGMGDNRKHNGGGGGGGQQHHRSRQQHQHQHQHHHHQHHQGSHHHGGGGGGGGGSGGGHGMMGGGNMAPMGGGGGNANAAGGGDYNDDEQTSDLQSFALDYLTEVIAELFDNPGMFEVVEKKLSSMFTDFRDDHYVLSNAVEMIFEQSIKESNFRYMGARLCQLLDSLDDKPESLMRVLLLLKMDDQQSELPNYMKQEQVKVRGTTLFLAELYMQLRSPQHKLGQDIARHIIHAIDNLLVKEGPENLKCICQCLKLCGFELEQDCCEDVHRILGKLQQSQSSSQSSVSNLIKSVLDLQSKSWGREIVPVAPMPDMPNMMGGAVAMPMGVGGHVFDDSPVFYGPDGEILTEEENSFLETNMINKQNAACDGYDDDEEVFDDMNPEEVNLAYKDFLQSVPNEQQQQQH